MKKYSGQETILAILQILKNQIAENTQTYDDMVNAIQKIIDENPDRFKGENVNVEADFLSENGYGNLRYYNGHFQYLNTTSGEWIDTSVTPDNVYIINMIPESMERIIGIYDNEINHYKLKWKEPEDTIINGQVASVVEKVVLRRKLDSCPSDENDGELVIEIPRSMFKTYENSWFTDETFTPNLGDTYYYKAFPINTLGFVNYSSDNETGGILAKDYTLYGMRINQANSDYDSMIEYIEDNKKFNKAGMNYTTDSFTCGDFDIAWFMKKFFPCMLNYNGTVAYKLDKNDYTKKLDGSSSDVTNSNFEGNAMIGFPKVYWKIVNNEDGTVDVLFSDKKVDDNFHCWSHIDNNGNEVDYIYYPIYKGSLINSKLRSLSGKTPQANTTRSQEITYAKANNLEGDNIWNTNFFSGWLLINLLLLLIGKSTNTKLTFGTGNNNSYVNSSNTGIKNTGTLDQKGLFWGNQDNKSAVKVFGIEDWWGNRWDSLAGWYNDKGIQKIKLTYGQSDGSTTDGYNITGDGYISIPNSTPSGTSGGYISKMVFTELGVAVPAVANGSATTYFTDGLWFNNSQLDYALVGGNAFGASRVGALCAALNHAVSNSDWSVGASPSCIPNAT